MGDVDHAREYDEESASIGSKKKKRDHNENW